MKYIVDFDGTITDIWNRYYRVYIDALNINENECKFEEYKKNKLLYVNDRKMIESTTAKQDITYEVFRNTKKAILESEDYLRLDQLIIDPDILKKFFLDNDALILTIRRNEKLFYDQMTWLGIDSLRERTVVLKPSGTNSKRDWCRKIDDEYWIVGDSETDMLVGKNKNAHTCFVKSGLRDSIYIQRYICPEKIVDNVESFIKMNYEVSLSNESN